MATRYYFDIRNGEELYADRQGIELRDEETAAHEAMQSLLSMAKDNPPLDKHNLLAFEVRTDEGPLFQVSLNQGITRR
ncbi:MULTISPECIES: DUF6894 family protein [unclassified Bradyrhizobium]|uniref:DUF6894 family protein n=1 Tax=unclassified Bradyrhizobium TaxID=2631580 RepID=UPI001BAC6F64|nr:MULTISPECIES: hypothetical protein [unclassified Bradyrhizobium]MBR1201829.1 hypothetical protein [Bradyrhizobium sp. AUGA SZCCT0124]MBR1311602.1 hypothetical protein [Bradyrhizobium sp. AUGA SZCCT0051]MBR1338778.1 hypothetical protein [Bradyrhizobium sp. AUGA SZCCT0105]MBR1353352.1 hypothetical protein [Bradyrhizobium sp. AUGA SZCCT0045]